MTVQRIPDNYPTVMPYLLVERVDDLIAFTTAVFDAKVHSRLTRDDGSVMHAELQVGAGVIMAGEPVGVFGAIPGSVFVYTEDCDAAYSRALEAGATPVMEPTDMPHAGERYGGVADQRGTLWWIATHTEDLSPEEQQRRIDEAASL